MVRALAILACVLSGNFLFAAQTSEPAYPKFDYDTARAHEIKPHRDTIPLEGIREGFNQLRLTLTVSPLGDVTHADANGEATVEKYWPQLQGEVYQWRFTPFEKDGKAVTAEIEEYLDLVPPERMPKVHVPAPPIRTDSKVEMTLERSACMGSCPAYTVTIGTDGIFFDGRFNVVANGKHADSVDANSVRDLAKQFVKADFYSMDPSYSASVTDCPTFQLSISIDGTKASVVDYMGTWVGMPAVIHDLEDRVDEFARTNRWIEGNDGLVAALHAEKYNFKTFDAQVMLKQALTNGQAATVRQLLDSGVPLNSLPAPKPKEPYESVPFEHVGWLTAASKHPEVLTLLIAEGAGKENQEDKDLALASAADAGNLESVRSLLALGANPNFDLMRIAGAGNGTALIKAADSGNPEVVREILAHHPKLEARNRDGETAMFAAGDYRDTDADGARVECIRLLAEAGANVNAKDDDGNTPLHGIFLEDVVEELIKLGADVNARNDVGETPIFTNVGDEAVRVLILHGADTTIRNKNGQTVFDLAHTHGPSREPALRQAIAEAAQQKVLRHHPLTPRL